MLAVMGALVAVELAVARRYGWHRDELYFLEAGQHLAWGYVDQPPLVPFVARVANEVAPGNLVVLRLLPALASAVTVALAALLAREMGAGRAGQIAAALSVAGGVFVLGVGHLLSTAAFDLTAWMAMLCVVARLLRTGDTRWWIPVGALAGVAMLNKNLVVLLGVSLLAGLVAERRWRLIATPWLLAGAALALAIALPNLLWQADHGWPQADMARVLEERTGAESRSTLVPLQLLFIGLPFLGVAWRGARALLREADLRPWRALLWAWLVCLAVTFVTGGRPYYPLPLTLVVLVAGLVALTRWEDIRRRAVVNALISLPLALPLVPMSTVHVVAAVNEVLIETIGWPELVDQVAAVVAALPEDERASVVLLTGSYGEAGALDRFGPARGLPPAYSPHNSYADFRRPTDDDATVVAVRFDPAELRPWFETCVAVARIATPHDVDNEVHGEPISVCRGLRQPWAATWEELRFLS